MNLVLGIETTTTAGSVVLIENPNRPDERTLISEQWRRDRSHAEVLGPALETIAPYFKKLSSIAVGQGPGSFTGIRVGINAARALGWSLKLPVVTVTSTENMIEGARASGALTPGELIVATLPAQMGLVFAQWSFGTGTGRQLSGPAAYSAQQLSALLLTLQNTHFAGQSVPIYLIGDGRTLVEDTLRGSGLKIQRPVGELDFPTGHVAIRLAQQRLFAPPFVRKDDKFSWQTAQPLYIRGSGAEEKLS